ncbi:MAG: hypothetical protein EBZ29_10785, partial [Synechococcaceae bacterium WB9_4xC_028]|nr:hypothetical protein [Synechococcaceae bacterium WB9_4xC_028]
GLWIAPLPCAWPVTDDMVNPPHYPLAMDEVHHVGEIVAIVLANSRYGAVDAAELVVVDYEPLDAVASIATARDGNTMAHSDLDSNKSFHWPLVPDPDALEAAFANATHSIEAEFVQQRLIPAAMEPRGVLAVPSPMGGDVTLYSATQVPHILKVMAAATTGIPESKIRVIAPSVGGGFGAKLNINPDEILAISLANKLGRAVRWTESRTEAAFSTHQGRGQLQKIELAADADGKLMGCRVHIDADMGAYMMLITPGVDQDILEGITRASVLELAKTMGIPTLERPVDKSELFIADEVFLSGTAAKVTPVRRVENTDLSSERPVMNAIRDRITAITEGRDPAFDHWVTRVRLNG